MKLINKHRLFLPSSPPAAVQLFVMAAIGRVFCQTNDVGFEYGRQVVNDILDQIIGHSIKSLSNTTSDANLGIGITAQLQLIEHPP